MKMTAWPCSFSRPSTFASSATPCGVSIEVGSSRIRTREPRQSALMISTCCWCAEGEVGRLRVRVDLDAELACELCEAAPGPADVQPQPTRVAEHQVVEDGQCRDQHRVLVHRADPELERLARRRDDGLDALDANLPGIRADEAGEDADQRRLAGSVLAEQAVHLARPEPQVDGVVREHARERLRDSRELDDRRVVPSVHPGRLGLLEERPPAAARRLPRADTVHGLLDQLLDGTRVVCHGNGDLPGLDLCLRRLDLGPGRRRDVLRAAAARCRRS